MCAAEAGPDHPGRANAGTARKEPVACPQRRTRMTTPSVPTLAVLALLALLGGCGSHVAVEAAGQQGSGSPTPAATRTPDAETAPPSGPTWPTYDVEDYTFTLRVLCYCPGAGVPVTVTVTNGTVASAVLARKGSGRPAGAPAPEWQRVTINDVIDAANDIDADTVDVRWPDGQDYPMSVWVDRDTHTIDEEVGYTIHDVDPA